MRWNNTPLISDSDMMRMQQDAVKRVQDMQRRSRETIESANAEIVVSQPSIQHSLPPSSHHQSGQQSSSRRNNTQGGGSPQNHNSPPRHQPIIVQPQNPVENLLQDGILNPISGLMEALGLDGETVLILGLIFILINEKADTTLILALCYLLF